MNTIRQMGSLQRYVSLQCFNVNGIDLKASFFGRRSRFISAFILAGTFCILTLYVAMHPVPVVLMFHSITTDLDTDSPNVSPDRFRAFVKELPSRATHVEITTDRSDSSIYSEFFLTLREHGLTATVFILPLEVGSDDALTWPQIVEMDRAGFIIGSHSLTHTWLSELTDGEVRCELCYSKALIEEKLGHTITALAYPYGAFDGRVKRIAEQCGYKRVYATAPGRRYSDHDSMAVKRVYINQQTLENSLLAWLALSGFYVTTRELALSLLPVEIPRKPEGWSRSSWRESVKGIEAIDRNGPYCSMMPSPAG